MVVADVSAANVGPVLWPLDSQPLTKPLNVSQSILAFLPESYGDARKHPLVPRPSGITVHYDRHWRVTTKREQFLPGIFPEIAVLHAVPVARVFKAESASQPSHVTLPVFLRTPKLLRGRAEQPLLPIVAWFVGHHSRRDRTVVLNQKCATLVIFEILIGHLIPICSAAIAQLLAQPLHVAAVVLSVLPKMPRSNTEEPFLPVIVGKALHHGRNGRATPVSHKHGPTAVPFEIVRGDVIPILGFAKTKPFAQPTHVLAAIRQAIPEAVGNPRFSPDWCQFQLLRPRLRGPPVAMYSILSGSLCHVSTEPGFEGQAVILNGDLRQFYLAERSDPPTLVSRNDL